MSTNRNVYGSLYGFCLVSLAACSLPSHQNKPVKWEDEKGKVTIVAPSTQTPQPQESAVPSESAVESSTGTGDVKVNSIVSAATPTAPAAQDKQTADGEPKDTNSAVVKDEPKPNDTRVGKTESSAEKQIQSIGDNAATKRTDPNQLVKIKFAKLEELRVDLRACRSEHAVARAEIDTVASKAKRAALEVCSAQIVDVKQSNLEQVKNEAVKYIAAVEKDLEVFKASSAVVHGKCRILKKDGSREVWVLQGACLDLVGKLVDNSGRISGIIDATNQEARTSFGILSMTCYTGHSHLRLAQQTCMERERSGHRSSFPASKTVVNDNVDSPKDSLKATSKDSPKDNPTSNPPK